MKKETKEKIITVLIWVVLITHTGCNWYSHRYEKKDFDKNEARKIVERTWEPVQVLKDDLILDEINNIILPPAYIQDRGELTDFLSISIARHVAEDFSNTLIVEDEEFGLIIDKKAYFPNIYQEEAYIFSTYTRKSRKMKEEELIIEEMGPMGRYNGYRRKNFYKKNEDGEWIHQGFSGTAWFFSTGEEDE